MFPVLISSVLYHSDQTIWPLFKAELTLLCMEGQGLAKESLFSFYPRQTVQVHLTVNLQFHLSRRCRKFVCNVSDLYVWCLCEGQEETSMVMKMSGDGSRCLLNDPNLSVLWVPLQWSFRLLEEFSNLKESEVGKSVCGGCCYFYHLIIVVRACWVFVL